MTDDTGDNPSLSEQLAQLERQHRALDQRISELQAFPYQDQLELQRMKKQKLRLKDAITRLRSLLIPDLDA